MLVLSRKRDEGIVVTIPPGFSGEMRICVVDVRGDKVRLGIQAPVEVLVDRDEVTQRKRGEAIQTAAAAHTIET